MLSFNNQYNEIGIKFAKSYYEKMSQNVISALILFDNNVIINIDDDHLSGSLNWLLKMSNTQIYRFNYYDITGVCQPLSNSDILISIQGKLQFIKYNDYYSPLLRFNETFIIGRQYDRYTIKNLILKTNT